MEFSFEILKTTFHHDHTKSEPAYYVSMAADFHGECLEVHEWIADVPDYETLVDEFKKESTRFLLNKDNWLKHGDFRDGKFKPFKQRLGAAKESDLLDEPHVSGEILQDDSGNSPRLTLVPNPQGVGEEKKI